MSTVEDALDQAGSLEQWVVARVLDWREYQEANYFKKWNEYYRIWRGHWDVADRERESERSRLISPASQQAVESSVSEVEEATFGRGSFFDVRDDVDDPEREDTEYLKNKLAQEFAYNDIRRDTCEATLLGAIFGTGIAEVTLDYKESYAPATEGDKLGRTVKEKVCIGLRPIRPHNFRIPDGATNVKDAFGCAIEEYVAQEVIWELQENGTYMETDVVVGNSQADTDLLADPTLPSQDHGMVERITYYGKVPREMLEAVEGYEETPNSTGDSEYVEAIVVIANGDTLLKAEANPYLMNDRPIVAFQWDTVPGRFWGRGVVEKGYNPQKALDAELRQRRDAMAFNVAPMMGVDVTRMPELGQRFEVKPGKRIKVAGRPSEVIEAIRFGELPQSSYLETESLAKMVQTATGAVDSVGVAGQINGEATAAGISMSLGAIIKRHKRTLLNFQDSFLVPFVEKAAHRYMQYDPTEFPVEDFKFNVTASLGIVAREYETSQLVQLLQTMPPDSPIYSTLVESIVDNTNIQNREEIIAQLRQANQPSEEQQKAQMEAQEREKQIHQAQMAVLQAQAKESNARAYKYTQEGKSVPNRTYNDYLNALSDINNDAMDDFKAGQTATQNQFQRLMDAAKFKLEEKKASAAAPSPAGEVVNFPTL